MFNQDVIDHHFQNDAIIKDKPKSRSIIQGGVTGSKRYKGVSIRGGRAGVF